MTRPWKIALLLIVILLFILSVSLAWSASQKTPEPSNMPVFSTEDRSVTEAYYTHLLGTLAPGSLDRSGFPLEIEKVLVAGSHVPMQMEKDLEPLPKKLESQLGQIVGDYGRYTLGRHVLLIRKADLTIADIIKNVAPGRKGLPRR